MDPETKYIIPPRNVLAPNNNEIPTVVKKELKLVPKPYIIAAEFQSLIDTDFDVRSIPSTEK